MQMVQLNLPPFEINCKKSNGKIVIYDILRKKYVALTPEEWVRQHFVHYLINHKGYPSTYMANEVAINVNGMSRRCDSVVYREGVLPLEPMMIIEYKETNVPITQKVVDQIYRYNTVLKVPYLIISNGMNHYCLKIDYDKEEYIFMKDIPEYPNILMTP